MTKMISIIMSVFMSNGTAANTLSGIAKKLQTTQKHLQDVNNIKDPDRIKPGMVLKY